MNLSSLGIGTSDVRSRFVLGCAPLGNLFTPVSDEDALQTLQAAWDAGVRAFDTAPHYGVGLSEERLGDFLRDKQRSEFVISTKVGRRLVDTSDDVSGVEGFFHTPSRMRVRDYSVEGVRRSLEESCERLGLDHVDIALIHDPDEFEDEALRYSYPALEALREEGAVRAIGLGMNQVAMLERFIRSTDIDCVLVAGRYSLLNNDADTDFFELCADRHVSVLVGGVFNSGVLANPTSEATYNYAPVHEQLLARVRAIDEVCLSYGVSLPVAALHYVLANRSVDAVVVGARNASEVRSDISYVDTSVPLALFDELRDRGLIEVAK